MAQEIIGREPEIKEIEALYQTDKPVFAVVYGRRRVGKTFLIRELLGDKFAFYHTGLSPYELQGKKLKEQQLSNLHRYLPYNKICGLLTFSETFHRNHLQI